VYFWAAPPAGATVADELGLAVVEGLGIGVVVLDEDGHAVGSVAAGAGAAPDVAEPGLCSADMLGGGTLRSLWQ